MEEKELPSGTPIECEVTDLSPGSEFVSFTKRCLGAILHFEVAAVTQAV